MTYQFLDSQFQEEEEDQNGSLQCHLDIKQGIENALKRRGGPTEVKHQIFTSNCSLDICSYIRQPTSGWHEVKNENNNIIEHYMIIEGFIYYNLETNERKSQKDFVDEIFNILLTCDESSVTNHLSKYEGCWNIIFFDMAKDKLLFGRDPRGRKSLLLGRGIGELSNKLILTSVHHYITDNNSKPFTWHEVDIQGLYSLHLNGNQLVTLNWPEDIMGITKRSTSLILPGNAFSHETRDEILINRLEYALEEAIKSQSFDIKENVALLFSGGLDSTVLAALMAKCLPSETVIELINISFGSTHEQLENTPDRIGGCASLLDLENAYPQRKFIFVRVNVCKDEIAKYSDRIALLMHPANTLMDISITAPLWFAARGSGITKDPITNEDIPYESKSKILFVGSGADEQFGGYGRHRVAFKKGSWESLQEALDLDTNRIWKRNLGRDDRVIGDLGKCTRIPFLDYGVMKWVSTQYIYDICDMNFDLGIGDKRVLRLLAQKLQLANASIQPKRAIQFGTKIVKQMPKGKGTDLYIINNDE